MLVGRLCKRELFREYYIIIIIFTFYLFIILFIVFIFLFIFYFCYIFKHKIIFINFLHKILYQKK